MAEYIGYHGTCNTNAVAIKSTNFRVNGAIGWLGKGAYFFEEEISLARDWAHKFFKNNAPVVIRCEIEVQPDLVFDATQKAFQKKFHEYRKEMIENQLKKHRLKLSGPQKKRT